MDSDSDADGKDKPRPGKPHKVLPSEIALSMDLATGEFIEPASARPNPAPAVETSAPEAAAPPSDPEPPAKAEEEKERLPPPMPPPPPPELPGNQAPPMVMIRLPVLVAIVLGVVLIGVLAYVFVANSQGGPDRAAIINRQVSPSLVRLELIGPSGSEVGSGFFVRPDVVVTNAHVISRALKSNWIVKASVAGKQLSYDFPLNDDHLIKADEDRYDLALLVVPEFGAPPLKLGDDRMIEAGMTVYALGVPLGMKGMGGLQGQITTGEIRTLSRWREGKDKVGLLQHTASIAGGNSGGPLVNRSGEVVGVNVAGVDVDLAQDMYLAIPVNDLKKFIEKAEPRMRQLPEILERLRN